MIMAMTIITIVMIMIIAIMMIVTILMITAGRKQEGSWGARVRNSRRVLSLWSQCRPATRVIIFIIIIWSSWWWWWLLSLWIRYRPTLNKVRSLFLSFDDRQYWWEPLMGTFRDPLRSLSPTFYHVLDYQNDHQYSIQPQKNSHQLQRDDACMRIGVNWMGVCENQPEGKNFKNVDDDEDMIILMTRTWSFWWGGQDYLQNISNCRDTAGPLLLIVSSFPKVLLLLYISGTLWLL